MNRLELNRLMNRLELNRLRKWVQKSVLLSGVGGGLFLLPGVAMCAAYVPNLEDVTGQLTASHVAIGTIATAILVIYAIIRMFKSMFAVS